MSRMIRRPLLHRQMTGAMFGEDATFIRVSQSRDKFGVTTESEERIPVRLATTPISPTDPRIALLIQGGTRIEDVREFFTDFSVRIQQRDKIEYPREGGTRYTIVSLAEYPSHYVLVGQRDEQQ